VKLHPLIWIAADIVVSLYSTPSVVSEAFAPIGEYQLGNSRSAGRTSRGRCRTAFSCNVPALPELSQRIALGTRNQRRDTDTTVSEAIVGRGEGVGGRGPRTAETVGVSVTDRGVHGEGFRWYAVGSSAVPAYTPIWIAGLFILIAIACLF